MGSKQLLIPMVIETGQGSFQRIGRATVDISLIAAAVFLVKEKNKIRTARIALGAVAPTPIRAVAAEEFIQSKDVEDLNEEDWAKLEDLASSCADPISDQRSGADYRRRMSGILTRRAIESCLEKLEEC